MMGCLVLCIGEVFDLYFYLSGVWKSGVEFEIVLNIIYVVEKSFDVWKRWLVLFIFLFFIDKSLLNIGLLIFYELKMDIVKVESRS